MSKIYMFKHKRLDCQVFCLRIFLVLNFHEFPNTFYCSTYVIYIDEMCNQIQRNPYYSVSKSKLKQSKL